MCERIAVRIGEPALIDVRPPDRRPARSCTVSCAPSSSRFSVTVPSATSRSPMIARERGARSDRPTSAAPSTAAPRTGISAATPSERREPRSARPSSRAGSPIVTTNARSPGSSGAASPSSLDRERDALEAHAEPDARHGRSAQRLGQPVVAAAAEQRRLLRGGALRERVADELERGARVVVEAAHERRRDDRLQPGLLQPGEHLREVFAARLAEAVDDRAAPRRRPPGTPRPCSRGPAAGSRGTGPCARRGAGRGSPRGTPPAPRGRPGGTCRRRSS